jgi:hypothetical protein
MTWTAGKSGNPTGKAKRDAYILRRLDDLTIKAVHAYEKILSDDQATNSERLQAANAVLDRVLGKPKQQIQSNVTVEHGPTAQLAALMGLSRSALTIDHDPPKLLNTLDNQPIIDVNDHSIIGK